jgi:Na+-transporting methylmalonyl-CoA/oxaloacetate decarboxylase gamma subunit
MSDFFTDLFQSIFTPGPTSSLVIATNVSFACLQLLLFVLLVATYSIHFLVLSILSAGLWWGINWFINELNAARALEEEQKKQAEEAGDDTETEAETVIATGSSSSGSKVAEVAQSRAGLKDPGEWGSKSETSTEDEWERVSEHEKDK